MLFPLWGMIYSIPYNLICVWTIVRMVPIRRPRLLFLVWQTACLPIFLIPSESAYGWMRAVLSSALWMAVVLLSSEKRSLRASFAAVLISLLSVASEVVASMLSILFLGKNADTAMLTNEPKTFLAVQIVFWNIFALLCWVLVRIWKRSVSSQEEIHLWRFALVPVSQHFLVMFSGVFSLFHHAPLRSYLLLGTMALCCALVDFLLFRVLQQYTAQQLAQQCADLLEEQLRQEMVYYNSMVAHIEETARLRHDLRNQLQTVYALMERGENDRAGDLLASFAAPLSVGEDVV